MKLYGHRDYSLVFPYVKHASAANCLYVILSVWIKSMPFRAMDVNTCCTVRSFSTSLLDLLTNRGIEMRLFIKTFVFCEKPTSS